MFYPQNFLSISVYVIQIISIYMTTSNLIILGMFFWIGYPYPQIQYGAATPGPMHDPVYDGML